MAGKSEGKRPLGIASRLDDNMKTYLQEIGFGDMYWIELAQNGKKWRSLANVGNLLTSGEPVSFSRRALLYGVSKSVEAGGKQHNDFHGCAPHQILFA